MRDDHWKCHKIDGNMHATCNHQPDIGLYKIDCAARRRSVTTVVSYLVYLLLSKCREKGLIVMWTAFTTSELFLTVSKLFISIFLVVLAQD
jgi:hypothetical protein